MLPSSVNYELGIFNEGDGMSVKISFYPNNVAFGVFCNYGNKTLLFKNNLMSNFPPFGPIHQKSQYLDT